MEGRLLIVTVFNHAYSMDAGAIAIANQILRGVVGSTAHGTAIDGQDDRDEMGVFIEPAENVCGLTPCAHYIYRDKPEGVRSGPGDLDLTLYGVLTHAALASRQESRWQKLTIAAANARLPLKCSHLMSPLTAKDRSGTSTASRRTSIDGANAMDYSLGCRGFERHAAPPSALRAMWT